MEAIIARGIQVLIALSGAYLIALWFVLVVWTYRDIESRSKSVVTQIFSTLLTTLFFIPGVLLYLILRPKETLDVAFQRSLEEEYLLQDLEELPLCHSCHRYVEDDFILCPHCQTRLREPCYACGRLVHLRWALCPYCGAEQSEKAAAERTRVTAPAARWTALPRPRRRPTTVVIPRPARTPALSAPAQTTPALESQSTQEDQVAAAATQRVSTNGAPVRLFDRRKTRAAHRAAETEGDQTRGQWGQENSAQPAANGSSANGAYHHENATESANGHAPEAKPEPQPRTLADLLAERRAAERQASGPPEERIPAHLLSEKD